MLDISQLSKKELQAYSSIVSDPIKWAEAFVCDPESNDGTGKYMKIKLNMVEKKILGSKSKKNVIRVHRRSGKSYSLCMRAIWRALTQESSQVLIICPDQAKVDALFELINEFIRVSPGFDDAVLNQQKRPAFIKFKNGSTIKGFTTGSSSQREAKVIRGQSADEIMVDEAAYLNESDWKAITAVMWGDATRSNIITWIASTPTQEHGQYYKWCCDPKDPDEPGEAWNAIHVPVTENPDYPKERIAEIKSSEVEAVYRQEWLAEFPDVGEGVFRPSYIERAQRSYTYYIKDDIDNGVIPPPAIRTMGVDWDKYQAGPNIIILELDTENQHYKVVYHEEIPTHDYVLTEMVNRIIKLDEAFNCHKIYVDRGYGEMQIETLHLHGLHNPKTGLADKVEGYTFSDHIEVLDPIGEKVKKPIKPVMVNILVKWLEDNRFVYSKYHKALTKQLHNYRIVAVSSTGIKYTDENEHIIDAVMLAGLAMFKNFADPFKFKQAMKSYVLDTPKPVDPRLLEAKKDTLQIKVEYDRDVVVKQSFNRGYIPQADKDFTFKRTNF